MVLNFIVFKLICLTQIELTVQCKKNNVLKLGMELGIGFMQMMLCPLLVMAFITSNIFSA